MNDKQQVITGTLRNYAAAMRIDLRIINHYEPAAYALDRHETLNILQHTNRRCSNIVDNILEFIDAL
jgi:hypothetical protein